MSGNIEQNLPSIGLFKVLSEYGLTEQTSILNRLNQFSLADWDSFVNSLETHFATIQIPSNSQILDPLTFCFPALESNAINNISSHVLISSQTYIDDPILDLAYWLSTPEDETLSAISTSKSTWKVIYQAVKPKVIQEVASYIQFYIRAKDAILSGKLVPFKDLQPSFISMELARALIQHFVGDKNLRRMYNLELPFSVELWIGLQKAFKGKNSLLPGIIKKPPVSLMSNEKFSLWAQNVPLMELQFISLMSLYTFGGLQGLSTDLVTNRNFYSLRNITEFLSELSQNPSRIQLPIGFSAQQLSIPLLCDVPIEILFDVTAHETESFQVFRTSLQQQLLNINAPVGTLERDKQIFEIQNKVQKEIADISLSYKSIKKRLSQKFAVYSLLGSFSIIIAGLSSLPQNLDTLSVAGSVMAGAGIGTSIKEFAKEWLDYQKELDSLRSNPNYYIWKLTAKESKFS